MFPLRYPWSEQPSTPVLASSTGLGEGLRHLWASDVIGSRGVFDAAGQANGVFGNNGSGLSGNQWGANSFSEFINFDDSGLSSFNSAIVTVGNSSGSGGPGSNVFSIQARVRIGALGSINTIYSGTIGGIQFRVDSSGTLTLNKAQTAAIGTSSETVSAGSDFDIGVSYNGTTATFYINGVAAGSGSSAQTFSAVQYLIGSVITNVTASNQERITNASRIYYLAVWNRPRSAAEFQEVALNPWGLFEPRRVWVPQRAGAASPVLSAATLTSIGTTTARPQVALTF